MINTEFDKKGLEALSALPDGELRERILSALQSCGIDRTAAARRLPDMRIIRKKLSSLSEKDIKALGTVLGEESINKLRDGLSNGPK